MATSIQRHNDNFVLSFTEAPVVGRSRDRAATGIEPAIFAFTLKCHSLHRTFKLFSTFKTIPNEQTRKAKSKKCRIEPRVKVYENIATISDIFDKSTSFLPRHIDTAAR